MLLVNYPAQRAGLLETEDRRNLRFATGCHSSPCKARGFLAGLVIKTKESGARIEKTGGGVKYVTPAEFRSMIERDKNTALEIAKKEGLLQALK